MAVLHLVYYPDPPLTQRAEPVTQFGPELEQLAADMLETMRAYEGVGLAAPQIGQSIRLFVMHEPDGEERCIVNPVLDELEGNEAGQEGCLSMPEIYADVSRATSLVLRAQDLQGNPFEMRAENLAARIMQHEYDHLEGVLFPSRLDVMTRGALLRDWAEVRGRLLAGAE